MTITPPRISRDTSVRAPLAGVTHRDVMNAVKTVMLFTIADVFDLEEHEVDWTDYHLRLALESFESADIISLPSPVRDEILSSEYSARLANRTHAHPRASDSTAAEADAVDWATVLGNIAVETFKCRPIVGGGFVGRVSGILRELGVGNPQTPRASRYLPTAVRYLKIA